MDWLITALSKVRELRDNKGLKKNGPEPSVETTIDLPQESTTLTIRPIGPALDTSRVRKDQRGNGHRRPENKRREPPRGPLPAAARPEAARNNAEPSRPASTDLPHDLIDRDALDVVRRLKRHGHTAYLVGGCVRDLSLQLTPKDFDIATSAKPEEIRGIFRNCRIIGRRFRLAHIYFRGGKIIETSTFRAQAGPVEVEEDGDEPADLLIRHDNVFGTAEEDARRRDFTINGLFYDPSTGKVIDFVGGVEDLKSRTVRMIGNPDIRLREDPVRVLRAVRIAAKTDLQIDPELLAAMRRHKLEIARCSKPRVLEETMRLFRTGHAEKSLRLLDETAVLDVVVPAICAYLTEAREAGVPEAEEKLYALLRALDVRARRGGTVSDVVVMAALFQAPLEALASQAEGHQRVMVLSRALLELAAEIGATRKMSERLRQIITAQRHFERPTGKRARRKIPIGTLVTRAWFPEALDLFEIVSGGTPEGGEDVAMWRQRLADVERGGGVQEDDDGDDGDSNGRPRRRRRRRNRSAGTTPAANQTPEMA